MKTYVHLRQYLAMIGFYSGDRLFPLRYKLRTEEKVDDLKKKDIIDWKSCDSLRINTLLMLYQTWNSMFKIRASFRCSY